MFADFTDVRGLQHSGYGGITTMIFPHMLDWSVIPRSACVLSRNDSFKQWFFQWWFFHTYQIGTLYPDVLVFFQAMVLPPSYRASVQTMGKFMRTNKHFYLLLHSAISISEQSKNNRTKCDDPGYVAKLWRLLEFRFTLLLFLLIWHTIIDQSLIIRRHILRSMSCDLLSFVNWELRWRFVMPSFLPSVWKLLTRISVFVVCIPLAKCQLFVCLDTFQPGLWHVEFVLLRCFVFSPSV